MNATSVFTQKVLAIGEESIDDESEGGDLCIG